MKIFLSYSVKGKVQFEEQYQSISEYITRHKYIHVNKEIDGYNPEELYTMLSTGAPQQKKKLFTSLINKIKKADICIFEASYHSLSTGFLIEKAIQLNKPVIALYLDNNLPHFLTTIVEDRFQLVQYSKDTLDKTLDDAITVATSLTEKRFNFFISPSLLNYLNKIARRDEITKSTFIRQLIMDYKRKNNR